MPVPPAPLTFVSLNLNDNISANSLLKNSCLSHMVGKFFEDFNVLLGYKKIPHTEH